MLGPASSAAAAAAAAASVAPTTDPVTTNGRDECPEGWVCFWVDPYYGSAMGKLAGNNTNWSAFKQWECDEWHRGERINWEDCASSTFNNGQNCSVKLYKDRGYTGEYLWEQRGSFRDNLAYDLDRYGVSFNDTISSNKWC